MSGYWVVIGTLAGVVVGGVVEYAFRRLSDRQVRREVVTDRLRAERRDAYTALLASVRLCAHQLARATEHAYGASLDDEGRANAAYLYDLEVVPRLTMVSLIGTPEAIEAAWEVGVRLERFRDYTTTGERRPQYRSTEYNAVYDPFREARNAFTTLVRAELTDPN